MGQIYKRFVYSIFAYICLSDNLFGYALLLWMLSSFFINKLRLKMRTYGFGVGFKYILQMIILRPK